MDIVLIGFCISEVINVLALYILGLWSLSRDYVQRFCMFSMYYTIQKCSPYISYIVFSVYYIQKCSPYISYIMSSVYYIQKCSPYISYIVFSVYYIQKCSPYYIYYIMFSGGTNFTIKGERLDSIQNPRLLIYVSVANGRRRRQTVAQERITLVSEVLYYCS